MTEKLSRDEMHSYYWKWDYETGQTQEEKDSNDIADSFWMGKSVSLSINVTGKQVNENPSNNQYAVTFDANGGSLQGYGNATQTTKNVTYGKKYGELPIPTRNGYAFKGWYIREEKDRVELSSPENGGNFVAFKSDIKIYPGANYTISIDSAKLTNGSSTKFSTYLYDYTTNVAINRIDMDFGDNILYSLKCKDNANYTHNLKLIIYDGIAGCTAGNATEFNNIVIGTNNLEAYTTSTIESILSNHTLTAIWEKIE